MADFLYYTIGGFALGAIAYSKRIPLLSFSGFYIFLTFLFIYIPGYLNYRGGISHAENSEINYLVYFLFLYQVVVSAWIVLYLWSSPSHTRIKLQNKTHSSLVLGIVVAFICVYTVLYLFINYDQIPLFLLFQGGTVAQAALARSILTHGFEPETQNWFFSYYRIFTKDILFIVLLPLLIRPKKNISATICIALLLATSLIAHIEKSYIVILIFTAFLLHQRFQPINTRQILWFSGLSFSGLVMANFFFFSNDIWEALSYLPYRLMIQVGYVPEQLLLSEPRIPLLLQGLNLGFVGKWLGVEYIDVSKLAWESIHHDLAAMGFQGSSAGASIPELYMIFGPLGLIISPIIISIHIKIDRVLRDSVLDYHPEKTHDLFLYSIYIYYFLFYPISLIGGALGALALPYIFQPPLFMAIMITVLIFNFKFYKSNSNF